jgi:Glycosyl transferase family 2
MTPGFPTPQTALLTTHFGETDWVELLLDRVRRIFPELGDERIFVIDQDRTDTSAARLRERLGPVQILSFPRSPAHVEATGHDHAHALNLGVRAIDSDYLMVFDSDAHPVSAAARALLAERIAKADAVLAAFDADGERTHPCFMLFGPAVDRGRIHFDANLFDEFVDTGRLIHGQIRALGLDADLLRPSPAFAGYWGTLYLDGQIYHHGSGSFASSDDRNLRAQAALFRHEQRFVRRRVFAGRYALSTPERLALRMLAAQRRLLTSGRSLLGRARRATRRVFRRRG